MTSAPTPSAPARRTPAVRAASGRRLLLALLLVAAPACAPAVGQPDVPTTARPSAVRAGDAPAGAGADTAGAAAGYALPADPTHVLRAFEPPPQPWAAGHRGVDLAVVPGQQVAAPQSGVVAFAGPVAGRGVVTLRHDDGLTSSLEPVAASVAVGTRVGRGAPVGVVDGDGHCGGPACLHWGVRTAPDRYVDPLALVRGTGPVVLLPG